MKSQQAVIKPKRRCVLRSTVVGTRRLILYQSLRDALDIDPAPDDPLTVTVARAQQLSGLSRATISRMMAAGNADVAA
jgi:hypothetical protein